jgi:hypothetical protein
LKGKMMEIVTSIETQAAKVVTGDSKKEGTTTIRVSEKTKRQIDMFLKKINSKTSGKRVKADAVVAHALIGFGDKDIKEIQSKTVSGKDRFESLYREHSCRKRGVNRDEFLDLILCGKVELSREK